MSQKIKTSVEIYGSLSASQIANATVDTDKFLVSDNGTVKYRTGAEMLSDLGVSPGTASILQHQVKAGVAINKGQAVYVTSADGTNMIVGLASNASEATSSKTMGLLNATVSINGFADVITEGLLTGLNTIGANAGDPVWLGTSGNLIYGLANKPYAPNHLVFIGIVTRVNANNGEIFVKVQNGFELDELHDVDLKSTTPSGNDVLTYEGAPSNVWKPKSISTILGYTPANDARTISTTSPLQGGGDLSANRTLSISQANSTTNGYLSFTDWNTFNNKQNALTNPITGIGSNLDPNTYALQDGTILYHSVKWFTPTGTVSTSGTTVTSVGTQFTSAMVGAKLTINGEWRIITAFTNTTTVVVESDYSENYSGVVAENWGVYSKERENVRGFINQYTSFGFNYIKSELYTALGINNLNTILKSQVGTSGNARLLTIKDSGNIEKAYFRADGTIMGQSIGTTDNALIAMSQDSNRKGLNLANNAFVMWSNSNAYYNTKDLGLRRNNAGVIEIYDGVTATGLEANRRDLLVRNTFASKILIGTFTDDTVNRLQVTGSVKATSSVQVGDNALAASSTNVGAIRYRSDANNSYMDMVMQTGASTYAWVNVVKNTW